MSGPAGAYHVVVGVDGSQPAEAALRWAAWQARLAAGELEAITAWNSSTIYDQYMYSGAEYLNALAEAFGAGLRRLDVGARLATACPEVGAGLDYDEPHGVE